jgi:hypothetical protein
MIFLYLKWYLISWIVGFIGLVLGFDIPLSLQGAWGNTYALILWAFMVPPIMGASVLGFVYFLFKLEPFLPKGYKRYDAKKLNSSIIIFLSVIAFIIDQFVPSKSCSWGRATLSN